MKGAIAAGHPLTAEAGARVLESGGNAVDACIAAAFAAFVAEGPLTGPAGGGFFLAHVEGEVTLLDCFFAVPTEPLGEIEHLTVDFGSSTQSYHVGDGSIAVPGLLAGLSEAHRRFGELPWRELVAPAIELARAGVEVSEAQVFLHEILVGVLQRDEGGRRIYGNSGPPRHDRARRHARARPRRSPSRPSASSCPSSSRPRRVFAHRTRAAAQHDRRTETC